MLLLPHQQKALDERSASANAFRLSGMDADTYIRLNGLTMCSRTLESWGDKLDPNNPYALLDRRFLRLPDPYKLTDLVRIILLALWFMGRRNRRRKDGIVTVAEAIKECGELLKGDIFKCSGEKLPGKSSVYALFADAKSHLACLDEQQMEQFQEVLDHYGRKVPFSNFVWEHDARQFDPKFCREQDAAIIDDITMKQVFPWSQSIMDVFSRDCCAAEILEGAPNSLATVLLIRKAVMPVTGSTDLLQGSPVFWRYDKGSENKGLVHTILTRLGVEDYLTPRAAPKMKPFVERLHLTFAQYLRMAPEDSFVWQRPDGVSIRAILLSTFTKTSMSFELHKSIHRNDSNSLLVHDCQPLARSSYGQCLALLSASVRNAHPFALKHDSSGVSLKAMFEWIGQGQLRAIAFTNVHHWRGPGMDLMTEINKEACLRKIDLQCYVSSHLALPKLVEGAKIQKTQFFPEVSLPFLGEEELRTVLNSWPATLNKFASLSFNSEGAQTDGTKILLEHTAGNFGLIEQFAQKLMRRAPRARDLEKLRKHAMDVLATICSFCGNPVESSSASAVSSGPPVKRFNKLPGSAKKK